MIEIKDTVTKVFSNGTKDSFAILTYIDIKSGAVDEFNTIKEKKLGYLVEKYPILKKEFIVKDNRTFLEDILDFNINDYYRVVEDTDFDKYTDILINSQFKQKAKWECLFVTDKAKCRVYFKIEHSYADGYKLIEMLMNLFEETEPKNLFTRSTSFMNSLYYIIFGTVMVFINSISVFIGMFFSKVDTVSEKVDIIRCKSLSLSEIRRIAKELNITVNDFLYCLMLKTDYLYLNKKRDLITMIPLNSSGVKYNNNMIPIYNKCSNNMGKDSFKHVHEIFNSYKYSLYIPIVTFCIKHVPLFLSYDIMADVYSYIIKSSDYVFTNIIGPKHEIIEDVHFLTKPTYKEVIFNMISSNDNMNIVCSFKEGVIEKERFEQCIYKAYSELIEASTESDGQSK
jgi:hypothetical protein